VIETGNIKIAFDQSHVYPRKWLENKPEAFQRLLKIYKEKRPLCGCRNDRKLELYVAQKNFFYLAKMPNTGHLHASYCPFYESEVSTSGRQVYRKSAIQVTDEDQTAIKMSCGLGVITPAIDAAASSEPGPDDKIKVKKGRVSLIALIHLLWEKMEYHRWHPNMSGRRNYFTWHKHALEAAQHIEVKKSPLSNYLYIPEPFRVDNAEEIITRTKRKLNQLLKDNRGRAKRMLTIGILKSIKQTDYGYAIRLKHTPQNIVFYVDFETIEKYFKKTGAEQDIHDWLEDPTMNEAVALAVQRSEKGYLTVKQMASQHVTTNFIPFHDPAENEIAGYLKTRMYQKQLAYDASSSHPYPNYLLLDAGHDQLPLYVLGLPGSSKRDAVIREQIEKHEENEEPFWFWDLSIEENFPELPKSMRLTQ